METVPPSPTPVLDAVWLESRAWSAESRVRKNRLSEWRNVALGLGVGAAAVGVAASQVSDIPLALARNPMTSTGLSLASTLLVGLAGLVGREILSPDSERRWAEARILAEGLKREVWRYLMRVDPYAGADADEILATRAAELRANRSLGEPIALVPAAASEIPRARAAEEYVTHRLQDQIGYYTRTAGKELERVRSFRAVAIALSAGTAVLGVVGSVWPNAAGWMPVFAAATAAIVAALQSSRAEALVALYDETRFNLVLLHARWQSSQASLTPANRRAAEIRLVEECEALLARESQSWRADWLDREQAEKRAAAIEKVVPPPSAP